MDNTWNLYSLKLRKYLNLTNQIHDNKCLTTVTVLHERVDILQNSESATNRGMNKKLL